MDSWEKQQTQLHDSKQMKEFSAENGVDEVAIEKQRIPFFGSMSKNKETTWVVMMMMMMITRKSSNWVVFVNNNNHNNSYFFFMAHNNS